MNNIFLETIGYYQILDALKQCALTKEAHEFIRKMEPLLSEAELRKNLRDTSQARKMLELAGSPPLPLMENIKEYVEKAVKGELLTPEQLEQIGMFLNAVKRLKTYLSKGEEKQINIAFYNENLEMPDELRAEIERCIRSGKVDDYASSYLNDIRKQISLLENKMTDKAEQSLKSNKDYISDSFVVQRSGRLCIPVRKEYRTRINGSVVEKSSTGMTLFMEPQTVAALREDLDFYRLEEDSEERRILYSLMNMISENETGLKENIRVIAILDFIFAKGKLSLDMNAVEPDITTKRYMKLESARHPMLEKEKCVPLDFEIGNGINGIIITGPNTGGKTVAIKTVALLSAMACSGLHIPCRLATVCMNNQILCDIGDGQNISDNLSTFSAHIKNVIEILKRANTESLVIMDELGSGTDPAEGMGIAIAILDQLRKSGALFLVTTHYPEVKEYAERYPEVINARMEFDRESLLPLYHLKIGVSGESCALYIAKRLGIPNEMLRTAAGEAYGTQAAEVMNKLDLHEEENELPKLKVSSIEKIPEQNMPKELHPEFSRGDSVIVLPDSIIGIVVKPVDRNGNVLVQIKKEKQLINHKRLKLKVAASQLYPEDYDFSIIFDTVENRKARHKMGKRHQEGLIIEVQE